MAQFNVLTVQEPIGTMEVFMPTKFNFRKVVRITAAIFKYMRKIGFKKKPENKLRMFVSRVENEVKIQEEKFFDHFIRYRLACM